MLNLHRQGDVAVCVTVALFFSGVAPTTAVPLTFASFPVSGSIKRRETKRWQAPYLCVLALHHERRVQLESEVEVVGLLQEAVVQHDNLFGKPEGRESGVGVGGVGWGLDEKNRRKLDEIANQR